MLLPLLESQEAIIKIQGQTRTHIKPNTLYILQIITFNHIETPTLIEYLYLQLFIRFELLHSSN